MFNRKFQARIENAGSSNVERQGQIVHPCRLKLSRALDEDFAALMGPQYVRAQKDLAGRLQKNAVFDLPQVAATATIKRYDETVRIVNMKGLSAKASAPKEKTDHPPLVELVFGFDFEERAFLFLNRYGGHLVEVLLEKTQTEVEDKIAEPAKPDRQTAMFGEGESA